jgi:Flp pilus assembly pilin Flp
MRERLMLWTVTAREWARSIRAREEGQAAVEYGVLLALILVAAIVVIGDVGTAVSTAFQSVVDALP